MNLDSQLPDPGDGIPAEVKGHEEHGHSARNLALLFLLCVAVLAVFFSMGFLVGYHERGSISAPTTEVVNAPPTIPPTVNRPAVTTGSAPQDLGASSAPAGQGLETEVVPSQGGGAAASAPAPAKPAPELKQVVPPPAKPASKPTAVAAAAPPAAVSGGVTLQVAALRTKQDAEHLVEILRSRSYPVFLVTPEHAHAGDNLYRVQVGPFRTRDEAEKMRTRLSQEGFKPFIKH